MKQRIQAVRESLNDILNHVEELRDIAADLKSLDVPTDMLNLAINNLNSFRIAIVALDDRFKLGEPKPMPNTIANLLAQEAGPCLSGGRADPQAAAKISSALDSFEDPPCIACGAPESVCECEDPAASDQSNENPGAASEPQGSSERVFEREAYLTGCDLTMACCDTEPVQISDEDYICPKCNRLCLGEHADDADLRAQVETAERRAGWDPSP
jgi:hypothetical protein